MFWDQLSIFFIQDADDMCMICFTEALSPIPSVQLSCGHIFHFLCVSMVLEKRWTGPRIAFGFRNCPICKSKIAHVALRKLLDPIDVLYDDVQKKALMRLEYEGLSKCEAVSTKGARFYNDPAGFALERYAYYVCFKCKKAYYGGEVQCDADAGIGDDYNPVSFHFYILFSAVKMQ
jgi:E3 ubiquitin-protein ligase MYCBP2